MIELKKIETFYGKKQVLYGISLNVAKTEIAALIGPNGAGKTTVLKSIMGLLSTSKGDIIYEGSSIIGKSPAANVEKGISLAPQGCSVFDELTVIENMEIGGINLDKRRMKRNIEEALEIFPDLKNKLALQAGSLSGGEQQMLSLARVLIQEAKLILLDEPSHGLAPKFVDSVFEKIQVIKEKKSITFLIVEQKVIKVLEIAQKVFVIKQGRVVFSGHSEKLLNDREKLKKMFL